MNDQEAIMTTSLPTNDFIAHSYALEGAGIALDIARRLPPPLKSIADQVIRSANSVPANLAEGNGRCGRDRLHHWRIAYASAKEVDSHLRLLVQTGTVDIKLSLTAMRLFDRVRAMTWRLIHPKT
ncbi:MAG: four helix bundle protein [bacterium]|nr:four helix bundle protein [bacterium]